MQHIFHIVVKPNEWQGSSLVVLVLDATQLDHLAKGLPEGHVVECTHAVCIGLLLVLRVLVGQVCQHVNTAPGQRPPDLPSDTGLLQSHMSL